MNFSTGGIGDRFKGNFGRSGFNQIQMGENCAGDYPSNEVQYPAVGSYPTRDNSEGEALREEAKRALEYQAPAPGVRATPAFVLEKKVESATTDRERSDAIRSYQQGVCRMVQDPNPGFLLKFDRLKLERLFPWKQAKPLLLFAAASLDLRKLNYLFDTYGHNFEVSDYEDFLRLAQAHKEALTENLPNLIRKVLRSRTHDAIMNKYNSTQARFNEYSEVNVDHLVAAADEFINMLTTRKNAFVASNQAQEQRIAQGFGVY